METDQLTEDIEFLRRRQRWLEARVQKPGLKFFDVREAQALDRVCSLLERAVSRVDGPRPADQKL